MRDAGNDVAKLPRISQMLGLLHKHGSLSDEALRQQLNESRETVATQLRLAQAFGLVVRIGNDNWPVCDVSVDEAGMILLEAIRGTIAAAPSVRTASLADVFMGLLSATSPERPTALALPLFRASVLQLFNERRIRLTGGSPETSRAKMRVLIPGGASGVQQRDVDLGRGDFLVPSTPAIVASIPEGDK